MNASVILLISACIYLAIGVPVAFALGLSTVTALMRMTGMGQNSSLGLLSSSTPVLSSHRAPSSVSPWMKARIKKNRPSYLQNLWMSCALSKVYIHIA